MQHRCQSILRFFFSIPFQILQERQYLHGVIVFSGAEWVKGNPGLVAVALFGVFRDPSNAGIDFPGFVIAGNVQFDNHGLARGEALMAKELCPSFAQVNNRKVVVRVFFLK